MNWSRSKWTKTTQLFVIAIVLLIGIYDLIALYFGGNAATISHLALELPSAVVFALGYCFGHMTWPQTKREG